MRMKRWGSACAAGFLLTLGVMASAPAVQAASAPKCHDGPQSIGVLGGKQTELPPLTATELEDAALIIKQSGRPAKEVRQRLRGQNSFSELVQTISTQFPENYGSAEWAPAKAAKNATARIVFSGGAPDAALVLIKKSPVPIEVLTSDAPNEKTREENARQVSAELMAEPGVAEAIVFSDDITGEVTVEYRGSADELAVKSAALGMLERQSAAKESTPFKQADSASVHVKVRKSAAKSLGSAEYRGGMGLSPNGCTGGFVVKYGNTYGLASTITPVNASRTPSASIGAAHKGAPIPRPKCPLARHIVPAQSTFAIPSPQTP